MPLCSIMSEMEAGHGETDRSCGGRNGENAAHSRFGNTRHLLKEMTASVVTFIRVTCLQLVCFYMVHTEQKVETFLLLKLL